MFVEPIGESAARKDLRSSSARKEESDGNQNIADAVNGWISESRENRRAEKAFSVERISAWKLIPLSSTG